MPCSLHLFLLILQALEDSIGIETVTICSQRGCQQVDVGGLPWGLQANLQGAVDDHADLSL